MAENWTHKFRVEDIGTQSTITGMRPGDMIARAVTEIQEKAVTDGVGGDGVIVTKYKNGIRIDFDPASISDDVAQALLEVLKTTIKNYPSQNFILPDGGQLYQVLQRGSDGAAIWDYVRAAE